jgi:hypothetical protein
MRLDIANTGTGTVPNTYCKSLCLPVPIYQNRYRYQYARTGTYIPVPVPVPYCIIITNSVPNPIFPHPIHKNLCLPVPIYRYRYRTVQYNRYRSQCDFSPPNTVRKNLRLPIYRYRTVLSNNQCCGSRILNMTKIKFK